jgi:hypothetical protein
LVPDALVRVIVVQGCTVTDPDDLAQLQDVLDGESFVVVPRELLTRFAPRSRARAAVHRRLPDPGCCLASREQA